MTATAIAQVQTQDRLINQLQQNIKQSVDPIIANPITGGNILQNVVLKNGSNTINHKLNAKLQGWWLTRLRALAEVYDAQDSNPDPTKTLILVSNADVTVDLYVF